MSAKQFVSQNNLGTYDNLMKDWVDAKAIELTKAQYDLLPAADKAKDILYYVTDEAAGTLALGETSTDAYRGDRGKTAYDHSQLTSGNPHQVTAQDVGLGSALTGAIMASSPSSTTIYPVSPIELRKILKLILLGGDGTSDFTSEELTRIQTLLNNMEIVNEE